MLSYDEQVNIAKLRMRSVWRCFKINDVKQTKCADEMNSDQPLTDVAEV